MSTLKFCRECDNILHPKEDRERRILLYVCGNCDHQEEADDYCVYKCELNHSNGEHNQILQDVAVDPTLPRTRSVRCAVCNHPEAVFFKVTVSALWLQPKGRKEWHCSLSAAIQAAAIGGGINGVIPVTMD
ncbi:DNA-directed RNA polymerases II, IV and V subunit 9B-like isoform X1 [Phalaenopsis equestris]|uniref:DNA-directed RNA polymerases II, IV and V subunit 9B-like isoform X1 n=1 Tax=Phalaenopsis equestris TaxID=78828 RepID=UPI0009E35EFA|nr:DNA-directed RNA polymerases II, IV and V subunit 9B-like isoform X1 [Phalaenopsis equestris]